MPKPLLNQRNKSNKSSERQKFRANNEDTKVFTRKVRIMLNDPDATDSSSSSEDEKMETADYKNKKSSKSKRWPTWLGTFATAGEASHAYEAMRSKFDEILRATTTTICSDKNNNDGSNSNLEHLFLLRKATPITPEAAAPGYSDGRGLLSQRGFQVSVLDLGITDSNTIQNGKSADHSVKETISTNSVGQLQIPLNSSFLNEEFESLYIEQQKQQNVFNFVPDKELNDPISSLEELGKYFDRIYCSIDDLKIGGFDDQPTNLLIMTLTIFQLISLI
ncbi:hypothetical protein M0R45_035339 [Rubus argutus]|uniref:AP2/ERF domain-containing protein n=1 Tax=Rubus argutus TaxID=59490 RepID=A0AAW1VUC2_RUBAR